MRRHAPLFALLVALAPPAHADLIYQVASLSGTPTFNQFDPALGTLDAVTILATASVPFEYQVTTPTGGPVLATYLANAGFTLDLPSGTTMNFEGQVGQVELLPGTNTYSLTIDGVFIAESIVPPDPALLDYEGTGTFGVSVSSFATIHFSFDLLHPRVVDAGPPVGTMTLRYDYTPGADPPAPAPEPASLWLLMAGMASITTWKSRRS